MDMKELGALLRSERENRGFSLEDVIQKTKISRRNLQALEEGDVQGMPHPVYAKGFIKNYAQVLELDPQKFLEVFDRTCPMEDCGVLSTRQEAREPIVNYDASMFKKKSSSGLLAVVALLVAVVVGAALSLDLSPLTSGKSTVMEDIPDAPQATPPAQETAPVPSSVEGIRDGAGEQSPASAMSGQASVEIEQSAQADLAPADEPEAAERREAMPDLVSEPESSPEEAVEPPEPETQPEARAGAQNERATTVSPGNILRVSADEPCWIRVTSDGTQRDLYLAPGQSREFSYQDSLTVRLGNAGGVRLYHKGEPYPLEAASGEVVLLTFP